MTNEILKDEMLNEEQLEQVAGGTVREMSKDMDFMKAAGVIKGFNLKLTVENLTRIWAQEGVACVLHNDKKNSNEYYVDGQQVTREAAMQHVLDKHGLSMPLIPYI